MEVSVVPESLPPLTGKPWRSEYLSRTELVALISKSGASIPTPVSRPRELARASASQSRHIAKLGHQNAERWRDALNYLRTHSDRGNRDDHIAAIYLVMGLGGLFGIGRLPI